MSTSVAFPSGCCMTRSSSPVGRTLSAGAALAGPDASLLFLVTAQTEKGRIVSRLRQC